MLRRDRLGPPFSDQVHAVRAAVELPSSRWAVRKLTAQQTGNEDVGRGCLARPIGLYRARLSCHTQHTLEALPQPP